MRGPIRSAIVYCIYEPLVLTVIDGEHNGTLSPAGTGRTLALHR